MPKKILIVGDSTAAGVASPYNTVPWSSSLVWEGATIANVAVGGTGYNTTYVPPGPSDPYYDGSVVWNGFTLPGPNFFSQIVTGVAAHNPDIVIVCGGTNDVGGFRTANPPGVGKVYTNYATNDTYLINRTVFDPKINQIRAYLVERGIEVYFTTIFPIGDTAQTPVPPYAGLTPTPVLVDSAQIVRKFNVDLQGYSSANPSVIDLRSTLQPLPSMFMRSVYNVFDHVHPSNDANTPISNAVASHLTRYTTREVEGSVPSLWIKNWNDLSNNTDGLASYVEIGKEGVIRRVNLKSEHDGFDGEVAYWAGGRGSNRRFMVVENVQTVGNPASERIRLLSMDEDGSLTTHVTSSSSDFLATDLFSTPNSGANYPLFSGPDPDKIWLFGKESTLGGGPQYPVVSQKFASISFSDGAAPGSLVSERFPATANSSLFTTPPGSFLFNTYPQTFGFECYDHTTGTLLQTNQVIVREDDDGNPLRDTLVYRHNITTPSTPSIAYDPATSLNGPGPGFVASALSVRDDVYACIWYGVRPTGAAITAGTVPSAIVTFNSLGETLDVLPQPLGAVSGSGSSISNTPAYLKIGTDETLWAFGCDEDRIIPIDVSSIGELDAGTLLLLPAEAITYSNWVWAQPAMAVPQDDPPVPGDQLPPKITGTLQCGKYDVWVYERGGEVPLGRVLFNSLSYGRKIDDVSTATVQLGIRGVKPYIIPPRDETTDVSPTSFLGDPDNCCWLLSEINPWEHELVIFRNGSVVWAGPIQTVEIDNGTGQATIEADDMMKWLDRRFIRCEIDMTEADLALIWLSVFRSAHDISPVGISTTVYRTGVKGDRYYAPDQFKVAGDELRELARTGLDWTVVGRQIIVGPQEISTPPIATLYDEAFQRAPVIVKSGIDTATRWVVGGGGAGADGPAYWASAPEIFQSDPSFGLVEKFVSEPSILDADDPESSSRAAAQTRWDLLHAPIVFLRDAVLAPTASVTMEELVPGARIDMNLVEVCQPIIEQYRLRDVNVSFTVGEKGGGTEEVKITVTPLGTENVGLETS
jgi:lysophospholipase L1-like esterase